MPRVHLSTIVSQRPKAVAFFAICVLLACAAAGINAEPDRALSGRVVKDDGSPLAGATVFVTADPSLRKTTDEKGQFHFSEDETERILKKAAIDKVARGADVVAISDEFGLEWILARRYATHPTKDDLGPDAAKNITLQLTHDVPIRGRFIDREGHPISNLKIELGQILVFPDADLTGWLKKWESSRGRSWSRLASYAERRYTPIQRRFNSPVGRQIPVSAEPGFATRFSTDEEGRFSIRSIGRDRAVWLIARHPDFVTKTIFVAAREEFALQPTDPTLPPLHPSTFTQVLEPARAVKGIVREHGTRKPLAGATVMISHAAGVEIAITALDGTFAVSGLGQNEKRGYRCVIVSAKGQPHLRREYHVAATPGRDPIDVSIELLRGTVITGVVRNKKTGEPLFRASLTYIPAPGNSNLNDVHKSGDGMWDDRLRTGLDGRFDMAIPPGPGLIGVRFSWDGASDQFRPCSREAFPYPLEEEDGEYYFRSATGRIVRPEQFHAVVKVNPAKDGIAKNLNITLNPN